MSQQRMTPAQKQVADNVVAEEGARRHHLVVHLSGAHAYGFPSHDSDLDLKSVHLAATRDLVGLTEVKPTFNRLEFVDGVEVDYTSNEAATALRGILRGDGNMLERLLSADPVASDDRLASLRPLVSDALSLKFFRHYHGFARAQAKLVTEAEAPSAKKLLYVLRTATTGAHLLLERVCEPDLTALHERYDLPEVPELVERKRSAERGTLDEAWIARVPALLDRVFARLGDAHERSGLPPEPPGADALDAWLIETRRQHW
ncbi:MAG: nucleotidyltransferase domain-containing protein [Myxococcota bacterium]